jgi:predicted O-methyltransferase YrrM
MSLINPLAEEYVKVYSTSLDNLLSQIETDVNQSHSHAHLLSGSIQGKFLMFISEMLKPSRILEIGTFIGYSTLCLSKGLMDEGLIHTIELRSEDAALAQNNFNLAYRESSIKLHIGNALDILPTINEEWDLIFIDADKVNYVNYYELTLPKLKRGGWMLVDNVLFHGQVLEENIKGKNAIAIDEFNKHVANDNRVEQLILTIRDGITIIKKL